MPAHLFLRICAWPQGARRPPTSENGAACLLQLHKHPRTNYLPMYSTANHRAARPTLFQTRRSRRCQKSGESSRQLSS